MAVTRVTYAERREIDQEGLAREQAYRIAMRRRHHLAHHDWGIVRGLELVSDGERVTVQAGAAIDGFGRELTLSNPTEIAPAVLEQVASDTVAVWLTYTRTSFPCAADRLEEQVDIQIEAAGLLSDLDGRFPPQVSTTDLAFGPEAEPPDDPGRLWPVYLGGLFRASGKDPYTVVSAGRPYAMLRGERIAAPSGGVIMQAGEEIAGAPRRFAVTLGQAEKLAIDLDGNSLLRSDTTLYGNLTFDFAPPATGELAGLCAGTPTSQERSWGIDFTAIPPPAVAAPWQVYHSQQDATEQLRFEFFDPGKKGDRTAFGCALGIGQPLGFVPCVTVDANCRVTFAGDTTVKGSLVWGPAKADFADPRFQAELLTAWAQGLIGNTAGLSRYFGASVAISFQDLDPGVTAQPITGKLVLENPGSFLIVNIQLLQTLSPAGAVANPATFPVVNLGPHEIKTIDCEYRSPLAGTFDIVISAKGVAVPNGYDVTASLRKSVMVFPQLTLHVTPGLLPPDMLVGASAPYTGSVENTSAADAHVRLFARVTAPTGPPRETNLLPTGTALAAHDVKHASALFTPAAPGTHTVEIVAVGIAAGHGNSVTETTTSTVNVHNPASLTVAVVGLADADTTVAQQFTVRVTNQGDEAVTLTDLTILNNMLTSPVHLGAFPITLAPHTDRAFSGTFSPTHAGSLDITATLTATGPGGDTVHPGGTGHAQISLPPGPA